MARCAGIRHLPLYREAEKFLVIAIAATNCRVVAIHEKSLFYQPKLLRCEAGAGAVTVAISLSKCMSLYRVRLHSLKARGGSR